MEGCSHSVLNHMKLSFSSRPSPSLPFPPLPFYVVFEYEVKNYNEEKSWDLINYLCMFWRRLVLTCIFIKTIIHFTCMLSISIQCVSQNNTPFFLNLRPAFLPPDIWEKYHWPNTEFGNYF